MPGNSAGVAAVERAASLLEAFTDRDFSLSLGELSRRVSAQDEAVELALELTEHRLQVKVRLIVGDARDADHAAILVAHERALEDDGADDALLRQEAHLRARDELAAVHRLDGGSEGVAVLGMNEVDRVTPETLVDPVAGELGPARAQELPLVLSRTENHVPGSVEHVVDEPLEMGVRE